MGGSRSNNSDIALLFELLYSSEATNFATGCKAECDMNNSAAINVGIIGGGPMEKLAVAARAASANAELGVDIRLEGIAASCLESAQNYQAKFGFRHAFNLPRRCSRTIMSTRSS